CPRRGGRLVCIRRRRWGIRSVPPPKPFFFFFFFFFFLFFSFLLLVHRDLIVTLFLFRIYTNQVGIICTRSASSTDANCRRLRYKAGLVIHQFAMHFPLIEAGLVEGFAVIMASITIIAA